MTDVPSSPPEEAEVAVVAVTESPVAEVAVELAEAAEVVVAVDAVTDPVPKVVSSRKVRLMSTVPREADSARDTEARPVRRTIPSTARTVLEEVTEATEREATVRV